MLKFLPLTAAAVTAFAVSAFAQTSEPPLNTGAILSELKAIHEKQTEVSKTQKGKLIQEFQSRAANPAAALDFYVAAVKATQFDGESHAQTQFLDWKKKEAAHLKSRDFQNGLHLHLNYLVLTLQRGAGAELKALIPALTAHAQQVRAEQDAGNQDGILRGNLTDSIFVRWYQIGGLIGSVEDWEMSPNNVDGIYQKTVQPELRRLKDPHVTDYWDLKLQYEAGQTAKSALAFDAGKFEQIRKPELLWNRAEEFFAIGQKNRAATDMFALIKAYPSHPDSTKWVERLQDILTGTAEPIGTAAAQ